ncbi:DUF1127 domain-containing protein [Dongia sp.]|uniref:DUF1127 domain-containing protein n=1 Tax=Dongia sp. TaxID=1977262 RepID=UPI0035B110E5
MTQISLFAGSAASSKAGNGPFRGGLFRDAVAQPGRVASLFIAIEEWRERRRSRRDLMRLSDYQLKDIGISRLDAEQEFAKPFWRA